MKVLELIERLKEHDPDAEADLSEYDDVDAVVCPKEWWTVEDAPFGYLFWHHSEKLGITRSESGPAIYFAQVEALLKHLHLD